MYLPEDDMLNTMSKHVGVYIVQGNTVVIYNLCY